MTVVSHTEIKREECASQPMNGTEYLLSGNLSRFLTPTVEVVSDK